MAADALVAPWVLIPCGPWATPAMNTMYIICKLNAAQYWRVGVLSVMAADALWSPLEP